jgi:hypothetical protein
MPSYPNDAILAILANRQVELERASHGINGWGGGRCEMLPPGRQGAGMSMLLARRTKKERKRKRRSPTMEPNDQRFNFGCRQSGRAIWSGRSGASPPAAHEESPRSRLVPSVVNPVNPAPGSLKIQSQGADLPKCHRPSDPGDLPVIPPRRLFPGGAWGGNGQCRQTIEKKKSRDQTITDQWSHVAAGASSQSMGSPPPPPFGRERRLAADKPGGALRSEHHRCRFRGARLGLRAAASGPVPFVASGSVLTRGLPATGGGMKLCS